MRARAHQIESPNHALTQVEASEDDFRVPEKLKTQTLKAQHRAEAD